MRRFLLWPLWFAQGILAGFGAILPGVSGGTLCVIFGMYRPIVQLLSSPKKSIRENGVTLLIFILGVAVGFVGLSGIAAQLLERNETYVTCAFIGFIIGTLPQLWQDAGEQGRTKGSVFALTGGFLCMCALLFALRTGFSVTVSPNVGGYLLCGLLWGLSFIVPGLSSSSLLLFFGLYQPMLEGISSLDLSVLLPMGIGMLACLLLLSKAVGILYQKQYALVSHIVLGIVAATAVMILPIPSSLLQAAIQWGFIAGGALFSFGFSYLCGVLKAKAET